MSVTLSQPKPNFNHDSVLLKYWLYQQNCRQWRALNSIFDEFNNRYEVIMSFCETKKEQLKDDLTGRPEVSHVNWQGNTVSLRVNLCYSKYRGWKVIRNDFKPEHCRYSANYAGVSLNCGDYFMLINMINMKIEECPHLAE